MTADTYATQTTTMPADASPNAIAEHSRATRFKRRPAARRKPLTSEFVEWRNSLPTEMRDLVGVSGPAEPSRQGLNAMIKRMFVIGLAIAGLLSIFVVPASADEPTLFEFTEVFEDTNPCSGEIQTVTINLVLREHVDHPNNYIVSSSRTGSTSDGYILVSGHTNFVVNEAGERFIINDTWVNPDTGDRFRAQFVLVVNLEQGDVKIDRFRLQCVGAETILP